MEFMEIVKDYWSTQVQGHAMYQMVQKLKAMKKELNNLNWKNGNLFTKVEELRK